MSLTPIETYYKGYRFRSRLEARWAVFFDSLGLKWEYEKEGYRLNSGWYLPDFFLPDPNDKYPNAGYWVEIKGQPATENEKRLCDELCFLTKHNVYLMQGMPMDSLVYHVHHSMISGEYLILSFPSSNPMADEWFGLTCLLTRFIETPKNLDRALQVARSARFEHGENG